jgi:hypothetical protein
MFNWFKEQSAAEKLIVLSAAGLLLAVGLFGITTHWYQHT